MWCISDRFTRSLFDDGGEFDLIFVVAGAVACCGFRYFGCRLVAAVTAEARMALAAGCTLDEAWRTQVATGGRLLRPRSDTTGRAPNWR